MSQNREPQIDRGNARHEGCIDVAAPVPARQATSSTRDIAEPQAQAVRDATERVRARVARTTLDMLATGHDLLEVKAILGHGKFRGWLLREFGWSSRTAQRLMRAAEWAEGKSDTVANLDASAIYILSSPTASSQATKRVIELLNAGETMPVSKVRQIAEDAKAGKGANLSPSKAACPDMSGQIDFDWEGSAMMRAKNDAVTISEASPALSPKT